jgi:hypothetical protein
MRIVPNSVVSLIGAAIVACSVAARADDYRWEVGGAAQRVSFAGEHLDQWSLYGSYYFREVHTDSLPLSEAAFLGRDSSVMLQPSRFDVGGEHFDALRLQTDVYVPGTWLFLAAGLDRNETREVTFIGNAAVTKRDHVTHWDAAIGITPFDGLRISTDFAQHLDYDPNVQVKYVGKLGNSHYYGVGISAIDPRGGDFTYALSADYFLDRTLKVGVQFADGSNFWGVNAEKFFRENAGVGVGYFRDDLTHGVRLNGAWRF